MVAIGNERVGIESKVDRTSLRQAIRQELARDWWLLRTKKVDRIIWEFSRSPTTGEIGPNAPLLRKLRSLGFEIRINE